MKLYSLILCFVISIPLCGQETIRIDDSLAFKPVASVLVSQEQKEAIGEKVSSKSGQSILAMYLNTKNGLAPVPVSGQYQLRKDSLYFSPTNQLGAGLSFTIQHYLKNDTMSKNYLTPKSNLSKKPQASVLQIFPIADTLPANILFFHIRFSQPMEPFIEAYQNVVITGEDKKPVKMVWRQKSYWLDSNKVLVLMIHPGRVKRGIKGKSYYGPVFEKGETYTLTVQSKIKDAHGRPLLSSASKTFVAGGDDYSIPKINFDDFKVPSNGTKQPLEMVFSEGMDHGGLTDGVKVTNDKGEKIAGKLQWVSDGQYNFIPSSNWEKAKYKITYNKVVCDFAGNRLNRPFEITDIEEIEKDNIPVEWEFSIH